MGFVFEKLKNLMDAKWTLIITNWSFSCILWCWTIILWKQMFTVKALDWRAVVTPMSLGQTYAYPWLKSSHNRLRSETISYRGDTGNSCTFSISCRSSSLPIYVLTCNHWPSKKALFLADYQNQRRVKESKRKKEKRKWCW